MSLFPLPWHYLGATECLLYEESLASVDGQSKAGHGQPRGVLEDAKKRFEQDIRSLSRERFRGLLRGDKGESGETLLFEIVRRSLPLTPVTPELTWEPCKLGDLNVGFSTTVDELVLCCRDGGSYILYLPWPSSFDGLKTSDGEPVSSLKDQLMDSAPGEDAVWASSALKAVDILVHNEKSEVRDRAAKGELDKLIRETAKLGGGLGRFWATHEENRRMIETAVGRASQSEETDDSFCFVLGLNDNPEIPTALGDGLTKVLLARYPCGGIDGQD